MDTKKEKNKRDHIYIQNNVLNCDNRLIQKISCAVNRAFPEGTMKMIKIISGTVEPLLSGHHWDLAKVSA